MAIFTATQAAAIEAAGWTQQAAANNTQRVRFTRGAWRVSVELTARGAVSRASITREIDATGTRWETIESVSGRDAGKRETVLTWLLETVTGLIAQRHADYVDAQHQAALDALDARGADAHVAMMARAWGGGYEPNDHTGETRLRDAYRDAWEITRSHYEIKRSISALEIEHAAALRETHGIDTHITRVAQARAAEIGAEIAELRAAELDALESGHAVYVRTERAGASVEVPGYYVGAGSDALTSDLFARVVLSDVYGIAEVPISNVRPLRTGDRVRYTGAARGSDRLNRVYVVALGAGHYYRGVVYLRDAQGRPLELHCASVEALGAPAVSLTRAPRLWRVYFDNSRGAAALTVMATRRRDAERAALAMIEPSTAPVISAVYPLDAREFEAAL